MVLVFFGTLDQVNLGIFYAQKKYFHSFFLWWAPFSSFKIPYFPGGALIGWIMAINLLAAIVKRKLFQVKKLGLLFVHFGLLVLIFGAGLTSMLAVESQMSIKEGETKSYAIDIRNVELAIIDIGKESHDVVTAIPQHLLKKNSVINHDSLPFSVRIIDFYINAHLSMAQDAASPANRGLGPQIKVTPLKENVSPDAANQQAAYIEVFDEDGSLGMWLVSKALGAPQKLSYKGHEFTLILRPLRSYNPYTLTLKDFSHDRYAGTDIPKNFSSLISLNDEEKKELRDVLIYMNHPLRYRGKTYYQASFAENETVTILQVVENPSWLLPYISCALISLGLILHFLSHLLIFARKRAQ